MLLFIPYVIPGNGLPITVRSFGSIFPSTAQFNVGLDAEFLNGRISLTADYFKKNTKDMLLNLPLSATTGFATQLVNIGSIENEGWEFLLTTQNFKGKFNWTTTINFATLKIPLMISVRSHRY